MCVPFGKKVEDAADQPSVDDDGSEVIVNVRTSFTGRCEWSILIALRVSSCRASVAPNDVSRRRRCIKIYHPPKS